MSTRASLNLLILQLVSCLINSAPPKPFQSDLSELISNDISTTKYQCHDDNGQLGCSFNLTEIYTLAELQSTVYCNIPDVEQWNCTRCQSQKNIVDFQIDQFIYDTKWDLKAFVGYLPSTDSITVVFRGTDMRDLENWMLDLEGWQTSTSLPYNGAKDVRVHDGFYRSYFDSILHKEVTKQVVSLLETHGKDKNIKIVGHSMGAAFAELAALDFVLNSTIKNIDVVTFGSPRVGNLAYYKLFYSLFNDQKSWRITNKHDPVPFLPPTLLGYHHVSREAWIVSGENLSTGFDIMLCNGSGEDPDCHNSVAFFSFDSLDHTHYFGLQLYENYSQC
eukprot:TRINITY_DN24123_c0_g1_i8.p1 TRINITY_DN24123_c0_g1~~TRINITY_DN24123_c0_g1_i8.p1  ORF type:complete len:333 (-),score=31.02 TRINITY_DN24123_c0_g1_i8:1489-2487(-)